MFIKIMGELNYQKIYLKNYSKKPNYINAYINLGNLKEIIIILKSAIDLYNKALKINDKIPVTFYSLALAYQGLGEFKLAIEYAKKTLILDPKFTQADLLISQSTKYKHGNKHLIEMNLKIK